MNYITQNVYISYCKRNIIVFYFMRDASLCKTLYNIYTITDKLGTGFMETLFKNYIVNPK